jgi:hypothetical protein
MAASVGFLLNFFKVEVVAGLAEEYPTLERVRNIFTASI